MGNAGGAGAAARDPLRHRSRPVPHPAASSAPRRRPRRGRPGSSGSGSAGAGTPPLPGERTGRPSRRSRLKTTRPEPPRRRRPRGGRRRRGSVSRPITTAAGAEASTSTHPRRRCAPGVHQQSARRGGASQLAQQIALELPTLDRVEVGDVALAGAQRVAVGLHQGEGIAPRSGDEHRLDRRGSAPGLPPSRARPRRAARSSTGMSCMTHSIHAGRRRPVSRTPVLGWDIGGVNTKAARVELRAADGPSVTRALSSRSRCSGTRRCSSRRSAGSRPRWAARRWPHAVTMTAELSQAFRTKREGSASCSTRSAERFPASRLKVYTVDGRLSRPGGGAGATAGGRRGELGGDGAVRRPGRARLPAGGHRHHLDRHHPHHRRRAGRRGSHRPGAPAERRAGLHRRAPHAGRGRGPRGPALGRAAAPSPPSGSP